MQPSAHYIDFIPLIYTKSRLTIMFPTPYATFLCHHDYDTIIAIKVEIVWFWIMDFNYGG